jgi:outer membrane protein OmpA-like peptidoglycan-associated protein
MSMTVNRPLLSCAAFFVAALSVPLVAACHSRVPSSPSGGLTKPINPPETPDLGRGADRATGYTLYHIRLGETLADICKGPAPFFDFDSAAADPNDQPTMRTLSNCMLDGPLKGKSIRLIGHTDPRGTAEYNDKLGLERAERVKQYLIKHGVEGSRVSVESAGEDTASNVPADWPKERRVEIQLAR